MNRVVIGVASNIAPEKNIPSARKILKREFGSIRESEYRRTAPIGRPGQPDYLNGAILVQTLMSSEEVKARLTQVEASLGRVRRDDKYAARTIDLDILVWNGEIVDADLLGRWFLVEAVRELVPDALPTGV